MAPPKALDRGSKPLRSRPPHFIVLPAPGIPKTSATRPPTRATGQRGRTPRLEGRQAADPARPRTTTVISSSSFRLRTSTDNLAQEGQPFGRFGYTRRSRTCPDCGLTDVSPDHANTGCWRMHKGRSGRPTTQRAGNINLEAAGVSLALPGMDLEEPMPAGTIHSPPSSQPASIIRAQKTGLVRHGTERGGAMKNDTPAQSQASTTVTRDSSAMSIVSTGLYTDYSMASLSQDSSLMSFGSIDTIQENSSPSSPPDFPFGSPMAIASPSSSQTDEIMGSASQASERMQEDTPPPPSQPGVRSMSISSGRPRTHLSADFSMRSVPLQGSCLRNESSEAMLEDISRWDPGSPVSINHPGGTSQSSRQYVARGVSNARGGHCPSCGNSRTTVREDPLSSPSPNFFWGSPMSTASPPPSQLSSSQSSSSASSQDAAGCYSCQCGWVQIHPLVEALKSADTIEQQFVVTFTRTTGRAASRSARKRK